MVSVNSTGKEPSNNAPHYRENRAAGIVTHLLDFRRRHVPELFAGTIIFMPLNLYIISSWHPWWYAGSFGQRPFVESVPIFALGFASLWTSLPKSFTRRVLIPFIVVSTAISLIYMIAYWKHVIPYDGPTWEQYSKVFLFR